MRKKEVAEYPARMRDFFERIAGRGVCRDDRAQYCGALYV